MALVYHGPDLSEGRWHLGFHDTLRGHKRRWHWFSRSKEGWWGIKADGVCSLTVQEYRRRQCCWVPAEWTHSGFGDIRCPPSQGQPTTLLHSGVLTSEEIISGEGKWGIYMAPHYLRLQQCFLQFCSSNLKWRIQLFAEVPVLVASWIQKWATFFLAKPPLVGKVPKNLRYELHLPSQDRQELVKRLKLKIKSEAEVKGCDLELGAFPSSPPASGEAETLH